MNDQPETDQTLPTRAGFVALMGPTNAGKSTLLNRLVGSKVAIVSHKVQTTRALIRGIGMFEETQVVFIDTPGLFTPKRRLDRANNVASHSDTVRSGADPIGRFGGNDERGLC